MAFYGVIPPYRPHVIPCQQLFYREVSTNVPFSNCYLPNTKPLGPVTSTQDEALNIPRVEDITDQHNASSDFVQTTRGQPYITRSPDTSLPSADFADMGTRMRQDRQSLKTAEGLHEVQFHQLKWQLQQLKSIIESVVHAQRQASKDLEVVKRRITEGDDFPSPRHYEQVQLVQQRVDQQGQKIQQEIQEEFRRLAIQMTTLSQKKAQEQAEEVEKQHQDQIRELQQQLQCAIQEEAQRQTKEMQTFQQLHNDLQKEAQRHAIEIHNSQQLAQNLVEAAKQQVEQFLQREAEQSERLEQLAQQVQEEARKRSQEVEQRFQLEIWQVKQEMQQHVEQHLKKCFMQCFDEQLQQNSDKRVQQRATKTPLSQAEAQTTLKQQISGAKGVRRSQRLKQDTAKVGKKRSKKRH